VTRREESGGEAVVDRDLRCEETLPVGDPERVVHDALQDVENAPLRSDLPEPRVAVRYRPVVDVEAVTRATFETSAGVVHRVDRRDHLVVEADDGGPRLVPDAVVDLVGVEPVPLAAAQAEHGGEAARFSGTGEQYREWAVEHLRAVLAEAVTYAGEGGETHTAECRPEPDDVSIRSLRPLYLPRVEAVVESGDYRHRYEYDAAGGRHVVRDDGVRSCDHCETAGAAAARYTYCENCGSVACESHVRTERLTGDPVCTGCAVTERFCRSRKYFFDEANAETFRESYEAMPRHERLRENVPLAVGVGAVVALVLLAATVALL
jgi:restriction endonuclease Mrr